jgi:uncharacterized caspase-like protein
MCPGRDLDGDTLRHAFRDFLDKAGHSGPDTVAVVYFAGYGLQFEGENYVVPVDAQIPKAADVPIQAVRVSDLMRPLAELPMKARIVVLDAARENPYAREGQPLASGLALVEPDPGTQVAFNAAPGTVVPAEQGDAYSAYARALAEMIRDGGVPLKDVFDQVRLRVSDLTKGTEVPWDADRVDAPFVFFERAPDAPAPPSNAGLSALRDRPIRELGATEAYQAALDRDTIAAYQEFLGAYPRDPMAKRVRAILAARREAATWRRSLDVGTPDAYWSYLRRYPRGPHAADCHRRLARLAVALEPPPAFDEIEYDLPPPPPEEIVIVDRPVLTFADPHFNLPPPPPVIVLAPPPYIIDLPPPPPPVDVFVLPVPVYEPLPIWVDWPVYVAPPPVNIISYNIHNTVIVNPVEKTVIVRDPKGQPVPPFANAVAAGVLPRDAAPLLPGANGAGLLAEPQIKPGASRISPGVGAAVGAGAAAAITRVALPPLPPSVAARAERERRPGTSPAGGPAPGVLAPNGHPPAPGQQTVRPLPGQASPGPQLPQPRPGQVAPLQGQGHPQPSAAVPGAPLGAPGPTPPAPGQVQPNQTRPAPPAPGEAKQQHEQQIQQQRAQQIQQQRAQQIQQQHEQQIQQQRAQQIQQQRAQQIQQQRAQQIQQQRAQQIQQQRAQQIQQQHEQQIQQQRAQQIQQQHEQQIQQQRAQQTQQQRAQQIQQQRAQQIQQQHEQQIQQQRAQQIQQQRAQQIQQQHEQQIQQQAPQQRQQQMMQQRRAPGSANACGKPGQPPCK